MVFDRTRVTLYYARIPHYNARVSPIVLKSPPDYTQYVYDYIQVSR